MDKTMALQNRFDIKKKLFCFLSNTNLRSIIKREII